MAKPKPRISKPSKETTMRKSTHKAPETSKSQQVASEEDNFDVNNEEEAVFKMREEEEDSDEDSVNGEVDRDEADEEEEVDDNDEEPDLPLQLPEPVPVVPQKRKKGKDTQKPASSELSHNLSPFTFAKSLSEHINRHESEEIAKARKIIYNLTIFSMAELAKPQAHRELAARFLVLPSDLQ
jgi:archaellum component FlaD/FlaE